MSKLISTKSAPALSARTAASAALPRPRLRPLAFQDGMPASARWVREGILAALDKPAEKKSNAKDLAKKPAPKKGAKK